MSVELRCPLHPFLLCLYFVAFVFSENLGEIYLSQTTRPLIVVIFVTGLAFFLLARLFRNADKGALLTTLLLTFIVVTPAAAGLFPDVVGKHRTAIFVFLLLGFIVLAIVLLRAVKDWPKLTQTLNLSVGLMLILTFTRIGSYALGDDSSIVAQPLEVRPNLEGLLTAPEGDLPNIFYILTDSYARDDTLRDYFGYDNSEFTSFLKDRGFVIADESSSNYHRTYLVVPSLLNMDYVADENGFFNETSDGYKHMLVEHAFNNRVSAELRSLGYNIVTVTSENGGLVRTAQAQNLVPNQNGLLLKPFDAALWDTTILSRVVNRNTFSALVKALYSDQTKADKLLEKVFSNTLRFHVDFVLDEVVELSKETGPQFVIAHIMAPHPPFKFGRNAEGPSLFAEEFGGEEFGGMEYLTNNVKGYAEEMHYLNIELRNLIDTILENADRPPIIILQGDHGLRMTQIGNMTMDKASLVSDAF
jgi:hypothetical protein